MSHRFLISCALSSLVFACNSEETPVDGEPGDPDESPYAAALDDYWAMCVENGDGGETGLAVDSPDAFQIIDLWPDTVGPTGTAPFVVTVGRLHPMPLEASFLTVRAYPIDSEGLELVPMQPADHSADDSPIPPNRRNDPDTRRFDDIERDVYGIAVDMGELFHDPLGNLDHGVLPGCEAAVMRGELIAHDPGVYRVQVDLVFEDSNGREFVRGDVVEIIAE